MKAVINNSVKLDMLVSFIDILAFNAGLFTCYSLGLWPVVADSKLLFFYWIVANISYVLSLSFIFIKLHRRLIQPFFVLKNTFRTSLFFLLLYTAILGMSNHVVPNFLRSLPIAAVIFIFISVERLFLRKLLMNLRNMGYNNINTIVLGDGFNARKVIGVMNDLWSGYRLLGIFCNEDEYDINKMANEGEGTDDAYSQQKYSTPRLGSIDDVLTFIESGNRVDEIYICLTEDNLKRLKELLAFCEHHFIRIRFIPQNNGFVVKKIVEFGDTYIVQQYDEPLKTPSNRFIKRMFDVCVSLLFLCTLFPIIYIIVAIVSKITMPGPIFFKQERTGFDGKNFWCYKFRSMKVNVDADKQQATKDDPRVTKFGAFLRHSNIDELPQFFNVLKGDMSLVGPRPHMLSHTEYYSNCISDYMIRHYVKPGITGWAQTHGERGETKEVADMKRRVEKDIWYVEHWNFWLDIQIMFKTVFDVIRGDKKAY